MQRTQISLTDEIRSVLDAESARTGQSMAALIRGAIETVYGLERSVEEDLAAMRAAFGSWRGRDEDGEQWVEQLRSGARVRRRSS